MEIKVVKVFIRHFIKHNTFANIVYVNEIVLIADIYSSVMATLWNDGMVV